MKLRIALLLACLFIAVPSLLGAQPVDEILTKHIAAVGGLENINKIKTLQIEGSIAMLRGEKTFDGSFTRFITQPHEVVTDVTVGPRHRRECASKSSAWASLKQGEKSDIRLLGGTYVNLLRVDALVGGPLAHARENGLKVEKTGMDYEGGVKVYFLRCTDDSGFSFVSLVRADNFLETKRTMFADGSNGGTIEITMTFDDYRKQDGVMFPHKMTMERKEERKASSTTKRARGRGNSGIATWTVKAITVNPEIPAARYEMPALTVN